jgi:hypothetical protein
MSYDFIVYVRREQLPSAEQVSDELEAHERELHVPSSVDFSTVRGYVPISDTGFEVTRSAITPQDVEDHRSALREDDEPDDEFVTVLLASDMQITFRCRSQREIEAARLVAGAVAKLSNGYISNPQDGTTVLADYLPGS